MIVGNFITKEVVKKAVKEVVKKAIKDKLYRNLGKDCTPLFLKKLEIEKALLGTIENPFRLPRCLNRELAGNGLFKEKTFKIHGRWVTGVFPGFKGLKVNLPESVQCYWDKYGKKNAGFYRGTMKEATLALREMLKKSPDLKKQFTKEQLEEIEAGKAKIRGKIWHHYEELDGKNPIMQLVDEKEHNLHKHTGGSYTWNEKNFIKHYGANWEKAPLMQSMNKELDQFGKSQQCKVLRVFSNKSNRFELSGDNNNLNGTDEHITASLVFPNGKKGAILLNEHINRVHPNWQKITYNRIEIIKQELQGKTIEVMFDSNEFRYKMNGLADTKTVFTQNEAIEIKPIFNEKELISRCKDILNQYEQKRTKGEFKIETLADKEKFISDIYDEIKSFFPINAKLEFKPLSKIICGYYNPETDTITLNRQHLYMPARDRMDTLLHECRHAFQYYAVSNPNDVDISPDIIKEWGNNMRYYCPPQLDYEAYCKQPLEVDARVFAIKVLNT